MARQRQGTALGQQVTGYEIHQGRQRPGPAARPWVELRDRFGTEPEGASDSGDQVKGPACTGCSRRTSSDRRSSKSWRGDWVGASGPPGSRSPTSARLTSTGWQISWK